MYCYSKNINGFTVTSSTNVLLTWLFHVFLESSFRESFPLFILAAFHIFSSQYPFYSLFVYSCIALLELLYLFQSIQYLKFFDVYSLQRSTSSSKRQKINSHRYLTFGRCSINQYSSLSSQLNQTWKKCFLLVEKVFVFILSWNVL